MTIVLLAIIAGCLVFGARAIGSVLGQVLMLAGVGTALIATGLIGKWAIGSATGGFLIGFGALVAFLLWGHFTTPREFRGMSEKQILAKLKADQDAAQADYNAAASRLAVLRQRQQ